MSMVDTVLNKYLPYENRTAKTERSPQNDPSCSSFSSVVSISELKREAGHDWHRLESDPKALDAFANCVRTTRMRRAGLVPPDYTAETTCKRCGPVPIFEGLGPTVDGCPWCFVGGYK